MDSFNTNKDVSINALSVIRWIGTHVSYSKSRFGLDFKESSEPEKVEFDGYLDGWAKG